MIDIAKNIHAVQTEIQHLVRRYCRDINNIQIIAVSKFHAIKAIETAYQHGLHHFGENYVQEALPKISAFKKENLTWHFIGRLQTNKLRVIAENFDWVHTVCTFKQALKLSQARPDSLAPLNVCIQVNLEPSSLKNGINLLDLPALINSLKEMPKIKLVGLMTMTQPQEDVSAQYKLYCQLSEARSRLNRDGMLSVLSMGMSQDIEAAIAAGSTHLRIGTALFGPRHDKEKKND